MASRNPPVHRIREFRHTKNPLVVWNACCSGRSKWFGWSNQTLGPHLAAKAADQIRPVCQFMGEFGILIKNSLPILTMTENKNWGDPKLPEMGTKIGSTTNIHKSHKNTRIKATEVLYNWAQTSIHSMHYKPQNKITKPRSSKRTKIHFSTKTIQNPQ